MVWCQDDETERTLVQLHFLRWRDKGVPGDLYSLRAFRRKVHVHVYIAACKLLQLASLLRDLICHTGPHSVPAIRQSYIPALTPAVGGVAQW